MGYIVVTMSTNTVCCTKFDSKLINVILLGISFMILFSADLAVINMQKTIISSIQDEKPDLDVEGYSLHGVSYTLYAIALWLAPAIVSFIGTRLGMILAGAGYTYYILAFNIEEEWAIYSGAIIVGFSAAILWTAENKYLLANSTPHTRSRNISIFWLLYSSSEFNGNIIIYFQLEGKKLIDGPTRHLLIYGLSCMSCLGLAVMLLLRPVERHKLQLERNNPVQELKDTWSIFITRDIRVLCVMFCYVGMSQAFSFGVYSPSVGFTLGFGNNAKQLVALSGIFLGSGEMICGGLQVLFSKFIHEHKYGRFGIVLIGFFLHIMAYSCIYLNLPNNAVFGNTTDPAYIEHSVLLAVLSSSLLGLADCCLNTQVYALLATMYPDGGAHTCALYKFTKAIFKASSFYCSNRLGLHTQLRILIPASIFGVAAFFTIDRKYRKILNTELELEDFNIHKNSQNPYTIVKNTK